MKTLMSLLLLAVSAETVAGTLIVNFSGFESDAGQAVLALFTREEWSFPPVTENAGIEYRLNIEGLAVNSEIPEIPHGTYAALVFHDLNENGRFDMGEESLGLSGVVPQMQAMGSPPEFEDVSFTVEEAPVALRFSVRKMERPSGPGSGGRPGGGGRPFQPGAPGQ